MTATYLFHSSGLAALAAYVAPNTLFTFDLDGTLAPIVEEYSEARVADSVRIELERLAKLAKVSVITGRSRKDALEILGFEPHLLVGNHGAEWPEDSYLRNRIFVSYCTTWRNQLLEYLEGIQGVEIEFRGESLSLHYRKAIDRESALARIDAVIEILEPRPRSIGGKLVVNLLPEEAFTKSEALIAAMDGFGLNRAMFFGDDLTDEEIFQLRCVDLFGVHIGKDDQTAAQYFIIKQSELLGLLKSMIETIEFRNGSGSKT